VRSLDEDRDPPPFEIKVRLIVRHPLASISS
jgi:hypothetical protein